jgi:hypothetical protein
MQMDFYYHSCGNADSGLLSATAVGMQMEDYYHPYLWESRWKSISILTAGGILRDKVNRKALSSSSTYTPS